MKKTIGVIGGMGPLATADLFKKMVLMTDANCDCEHLHVLIDNNTAIPDRTAAILHGGASPVPELVKSARTLAQAGADFLIMPCNTAHYFYEQLLEQSPLPVLHMPRLTAEHVGRCGLSGVGLLATDGTIATGIYERLFAEYGILCIKPDEAEQRAIMSMIYDDIKSGKKPADTGEIQAMLDGMRARGAQSFVLGCTELPIAFERYAFDAPFIDPTAVLAAGAVEFAGGRVKPCVF